MESAVHRRDAPNPTLTRLAHEQSVAVWGGGLRRLAHASSVRTAGDDGLRDTREKRIEKWNRAWKLALIETTNPDWRDLA